MAMTRRGFVVASGLAVLGALTARSARGLEAAEAAAAPALRPAALGTSAGRCAHCGSAGALDAGPGLCRRPRRRRRALQAAARRIGTRAGGPDG